MWGIIFIATLLFFVGVETWKMGKRFTLRRLDHRARTNMSELRISEKDEAKGDTAA